MKKYIIYLLIRTFHDFNHEKTDKTPAPEIQVHCDEQSEFEALLKDKADNVTVTPLHSFEASDDTLKSSLAFEWEYMQRIWRDTVPQAVNCMYDDDGGDGVQEPDLSDGDLVHRHVG